MIEIDHVFAFVEPQRAWAASLEGAGFRLDDGTTHPGQGTRNRRMLLARHYLEWIWLDARADAETNQVRLDRRADWERTGFSPFGIALRGPIHELGPELFVPYEPPYAPGMTIWLARACDEQPALPLIFLFDVPDAAGLERFWPAHRAGHDSPLLAHANGATKWRRLEFQTPVDVAWPLRIKPPELALTRGDTYALEIALDAPAALAIAPHVKIVPR